jgi:hypothetical protein
MHLFAVDHAVERSCLAGATPRACFGDDIETPNPLLKAFRRRCTSETISGARPLSIYRNIGTVLVPECSTLSPGLLKLGGAAQRLTLASKSKSQLSLLLRELNTHCAPLNVTPLRMTDQVLR